MQHRWCRHVLAAALVMTLAAGCGSATANTVKAPEKRDITVGVVASESSAGIYVAQEQGLFRKAGLDVTLKTITGAAAVLPALLHGSVEILGAQITTFIQAQAAGLAQFRILAPGGSLGPRVQAIMVPPGSPITTPAQLKGATVAVNAINGIDQLLAEVSLRDYGIQPGQVHYVAIPFQSMIKALAAHRVDAIYAAEPYVTEAEQQEGAQSLLDPDTGPAEDLPISAYTATAAWAERYPRTAAAFANAIDEADTLINTNLNVFEKAMAEQLHLQPDVTAVMARGNFPTGLATVQIQRVATILDEFGLLKKQFNVKGML
jgi:NitT/TauT family transport system substrate-binding protein